MNALAVIALIAMMVYRYFDVPNLISIIISTVKYTRMGISLLMPPKKGSVEYLRGGLLKVNYTDPNQKDGPGELSIILPYAVPAKHWDKVFVITVQSYQAYLDKLREDRKREADAQEAIEKARANSPSIEKMEIDHDLASDLSDIAGVEVDPSSLAVPRSTRSKPTDHDEVADQKCLKHQLKECEKEDITQLMLSMAGPGKDFFGVELAISQVYPDAKALIFIFGKKSKTFVEGDAIRL